MLRLISFLTAMLMASLASSSAQDCAGPMPGSCSLLKGARAVFVGSLVERGQRFRFRVDEHIKGEKDDYFEIEDLPLMSSHFELGKQYLVFVDSMPLKDGDHLFAHACGPTRELKRAAALLEQLRAEKNGKRNASVYGMLWRTSDPPGFSDDEFTRPLPGVIVKLQSEQGSFETTTDEHGAYAFERLPKGTYQVSAAMAPNLQLAPPISGQKPFPPFALPRRSCYENDITALPTGKITGRVVGPDGMPLDGTSVDLYRASQYDESHQGQFGYQGDSKPFEFGGLSAGDYILVFNRLNQLDPDAPFPRTFYPSAPDLHAAQIVHLEDGQHIGNADIHLRQALTSTRKLTVRLLWDGLDSRAYYPPNIVVKASTGTSPYPHRAVGGSYLLNLLPNAEYTLHAEAYCRTGTTAHGETSAITVDGGDPAISEVTLTFRTGGCASRASSLAQDDNRAGVGW
jgi:hypothetical protein